MVMCTGREKQPCPILSLSLGPLRFEHQVPPKRRYPLQNYKMSKSLPSKHFYMYIAYFFYTILLNVKACAQNYWVFGVCPSSGTPETIKPSSEPFRVKACGLSLFKLVI
jgi:hypothetical protein